MKNFKFSNHLILRTPHYSYDQYSIEKVEEILKDTYFQTALYLASPLLYNILFAKNFDYKALSAKEQLTIKRYFNRMSFRPIPFGSFSSFSTTDWGSGETIKLDSTQNAKLHLNIDQELVLHLAKSLTGAQPEKHIYFCNPALYNTGREFRFIKTYHTEKNKIEFELESYENNAITVSIIQYCQENFKFGYEIIAFVMKLTSCSLEGAKDYFNFLVGAQIIICETGINIIGVDYLERLAYSESLTTPFQHSLKGILHQIENNSFPGVNRLIEISAQLKSLISNIHLVKTKQYFYAGLEINVAQGNLENKYQQQITEGLEALKVWAMPAQPYMLQEFITDFKNRYDQQKIPLLVAIDPEKGIGYGPLKHTLDETELLRQVNFTDQKDSNIQLEWSAVHRLLLERWNQNERITDPIVLNGADLLAIPSKLSFPSPPTLSVLFRVIGDDVFLETVGGASATTLIGRFTAWSEEVYNLSKHLAAKEQSANPEVIFADIGQLSDTHADNINRRKHSYDYEIPINVVSTLSLEYQIALSDLWVSVVDNKLILESASHKKIIIPRLTSAYNYSRNNLAVFRILCDLQYQGLQANYSFELDNFFPGMAHYPRVVFKNTILCPAVWHLSVNDLLKIKSATEEKAISLFKAIQIKLKIPTNVALSRFDQQLVFNTEKEDEVLFLVQCLKSMDKAVLQEFFIPVKTILSNNEEQPLINQFIAFLYQEEAIYTGHKITDVVKTGKNKTEFIIGSKWLYLKLYCNPAFSNELLSKKIAPLLSQINQGTLFSWFFIRYLDSGYHIRLRLKVNNDSIGQILSKFRNRLSGSVHYHLIREYQADTYRREMERYGPDIIALVEDFFYGSSELILRYIKSSGLKSFKNTYHSLGFVTMEYLLNSFLPDTDEQITFLQQMVNTFYSEFSSDKLLKIDLDLKYRAIKNEIIELSASTDYYEKLKLTKWHTLFKSKTFPLIKAASTFSAKRKNQLLADLIHMHLNRLFIDRPRNQELIIYYCIYKHKLSMKAIANKH